MASPLRPAAGRSHQPGFGVPSFVPCGAGFAPGPGCFLWEKHGNSMAVLIDFHGQLSISDTCFHWMVDVSSGCCFINFRMNMSEFVEYLLNLVELVPSAHHMNSDSLE